MKCTNCHSENLEWISHVEASNSIVSGRLKTSDCTPTLVLGCVECSETLTIIHADLAAQWLTSQRKFAFDETRGVYFKRGK